MGERPQDRLAGQVDEVLTRLARATGTPSIDSPARDVIQIDSTVPFMGGRAK